MHSKFNIEFKTILHSFQKEYCHTNVAKNINYLAIQDTVKGIKQDIFGWLLALNDKAYFRECTKNKSLPMDQWCIGLAEYLEQTEIVLLLQIWQFYSNLAQIKVRQLKVKALSFNSFAELISLHHIHSIYGPQWTYPLQTILYIAKSLFMNVTKQRTTSFTNKYSLNWYVTMSK